MCASKEIFLCHQFYHQFYHKDTPKTDYHNRNGSHRLKKKKRIKSLPHVCMCESVCVSESESEKERERKKKRVKQG